eukprot:6201214-Alexandrium_andersonii.AAC.1
MVLKRNGHTSSAVASIQQSLYELLGQPAVEELLNTNSKRAGLNAKQLARLVPCQPPDRSPEQGRASDGFIPALASTRIPLSGQGGSAA